MSVSRALLAVVVIALAGCGRHERETKRELHTEDTMLTGLPGPQVATLSDAKPALSVTGVTGPVADGVRDELGRSDLVKRGAVAVAIQGVPARPASDGTLQLTIETTAVFAHPPQVSKLQSTITGRLEYHGLDANLLGHELGDIVVDWLANRKLPATVGLPAGPPAPAQHVASGSPSCSLHADGSVRCWEPSREAVPVSAVAGTKAIDAAQNYGACGVAGDGRAYCIDAWDNTTALEARHVCGVEHATAISVGQQTACAVVDGGHVRCWGRKPEWFEPCGSGKAAVEVKGVAGAETVDTGPFAGCARSHDGAVACWEHCGKDCKSGVQGQVDVAPAASPVKSLGKAVHLAVGHDACAASGDRVTCVDLPRGKPATTVVPEPVKQLARTAHGLCALGASGHVLCWGGKDKPAPVAGLDDVVALDADLAGTCAVTGKGAVLCWGRMGQPDNAPPTEIQITY